MKQITAELIFILALILTIVLFALLFAGQPDLMDAIRHRLECPHHQ